MKLIKILSAFAVFAAAGMVLAGCESLAGVGSGDEAVFAEASALAPDSAGAPLVAGAAGTKTIKVKFEVKNGGWGLSKSEGMLKTLDKSSVVYACNAFANDYTITITVPASDEYVWVHWKGTVFYLQPVYVKAKMKAVSGTITLDYNGRNDNFDHQVATKNLEVLSVVDHRAKTHDDLTGELISIGEYWDRLKSRSVMTNW